MAKAEAKTEVKVAAPKGTQKSEAILGTAIVKLGSGLRAFNEMVDEINKLDGQVQENMLIISDQEAKIAEQAQLLKNNIAQNKIELGQAYERDKLTFVNEWLQENNRVGVDKDELEELRNELTAAEEATDKEVKKEVAIVTNTLTRNFEASRKELELTFKAQEAENVAKLAQKEERIKFLESQVEFWRIELGKEREASVERAKASSIQQTISNGK